MFCTYKQILFLRTICLTCYKGPNVINTCLTNRRFLPVSLQWAWPRLDDPDTGTGVRFRLSSPPFWRWSWRQSLGRSLWGCTGGRLRSCRRRGSLPAGKRRSGRRTEISEIEIKKIGAADNVGRGWPVWLDVAMKSSPNYEFIQKLSNKVAPAVFA